MIVDVAAAVGEWPFYPLKRTQPAGLSTAMRDEGIGWALVSPLEGIFYQDPHMINPVHVERLYPYSNLLPVPIINPLMRNMEEELRRAAFEYEAKAVKVFPNYHTYDPGCEDFKRMVEACRDLSLCVMIQIRMEDSRRHHKLVQVPDVDIGEVLEVLNEVPHVPVVFCGLTIADLRNEKIKSGIINRPDTYVETSFLETLDTLNTALEMMDDAFERFIFGTHTPLFYLQANLQKLKALERKDARIAIGKNTAMEIFQL